MMARYFVVLTSILLIAADSAFSAVNYWRADKGRDFLQVADNTQPTTPANWYFYSDLGTEFSGDATNVVISGGNIAGSMAFDQNDSDWELYVGYTNQAALDAVFPSEASYSIILSGGTLGTVTQQFSIAADDYPPVPYLTGADYSTLQPLDIFEPIEVNWDLPTERIGSVGFEIVEGAFPADGDTVVDLFPGNTFTNAFLAGDFLVAGSNYSGFLQFSNSTDVNGSDGFEVDGITAFNSEAVFPLAAVNPAVGYDDFNDNSMDTNHWVQIFEDVDSDTFAETNNRLEYTSAGAGDTFVAWGAFDILSYTQDWAVAIDVTDSIPSNAFEGDEETYFGILVAPEGDIANNVSAEFLNSSSGRGVGTFASLDGDDEVLTDVYNQVSVETVSLKISFDADTKLLHTAYSTGGDYVAQTNYAASSWGMTDSSIFLCAVFSGNTNTPVAAGQIFADNYRVYDTPAISNEVSLIELEYNRDYEFPGTPPEGRENWYRFDLEASSRVESVTVLSPAGDLAEVLLDGTQGSTNYWYFETTEPITTPWNPVNDDDWIITVGYNNGTFQSTLVPFTQTNGAAIPVINKQPLFTSQGGLDGFVGNVASLDVTFNSADTSANFMHIDEFPDNENGEIRFYTDALPDVLGVVPTIHGPLATTSDTIPVIHGTNWWLLTHGWGRSDYNDEGVAFIVVKQTESDFIFMITDDADADSLPDDWETEFFGSTNAVNGGANDDFDEDGMINLHEFIAGVNPTNGGSVFVVEEPGPSPEGVVIYWDAVEGRKYGIYWAKELTDGFDAVAINLYYPQNSFTDTVHKVDGCGFYYIDVQLDD